MNVPVSLLTPFNKDFYRRVEDGDVVLHLDKLLQGRMVTNINSPVDVANKLLEQCEQVSEETGRTIKSSFNDDTPYQISRAVAAVLIFLNHADYASSKGKHTVLNIDFMRLGEEQPLLSYANDSDQIICYSTLSIFMP